MQTRIRYALVAGAIVAAGIGVAGAAMQTSSSGHQQNAHQLSAHQPPARSHGRAGQRFLSEYDLNHDGKVTRDEFNKAVAQRFAQATGGAKLMNEKQFEGYRTSSLHQHADQSFRRADWNGDGKLSFDEFAGPIRVSFERADKQSAGAILCRPRNAGNAPPAQDHRSRRGGSRGAGSFCPRDDLNHDGKVTRAELDQALHQQFASAAKGSALNKDQFEGMQHSRAEATSGRAFQRLDTNHDGKVTLQEFAASQQKTFARMDRNGDGTITRDEMVSARRYVSRSNGHS
jgi:Ca2+-binding EF-hand superfamily protein